MDLAAFARMRKTSFAVVRALEIIGEATKHIPAYVRATIRQLHGVHGWNAG